MFFLNAPIFYVQIFWNAPFSEWKLNWIELNLFGASDTWLVWKWKDEPKMKVFDFWAFKKYAYGLTWKIHLSHAFGAFHIIYPGYTDYPSPSYSEMNNDTSTEKSYFQDKISIKNTSSIVLCELYNIILFIWQMVILVD